MVKMADSSPHPFWRMLLPGLLILMLIGVAFFGKKGILFAINSNRQKEQLQRQIQDLELVNQNLRKEIEALRSDPRYVEAIARKELGMVRPDELVYQFRAPQASVPAKPATQPGSPSPDPGR